MAVPLFLNPDHRHPEGMHTAPAPSRTTLRAAAARSLRAPGQTRLGAHDWRLPVMEQPRHGSYICSMNDIDQIRGDHTRVCFAGAIGEARRGRPPEEPAVSIARAVQLLADDPAQCTCPRSRRGSRARARGWTAGERR
jgi:hypothetical protein